jgi:hypothetical protein
MKYGIPLSIEKQVLSFTFIAYTKSKRGNFKNYATKQCNYP